MPAAHFRRAMEAQIRHRDELAEALAAQSTHSGPFQSITSSISFTVISLCLGVFALRYYGIPALPAEAQEQYRRISKKISADVFLNDLEKQIKSGRNLLVANPSARNNPTGGSVEKKSVADLAQKLNSAGYSQQTSASARQALNDLQNPVLADAGEAQRKPEYREADAKASLKSLLENNLVDRDPAAVPVPQYRPLTVPPLQLIGDEKEFAPIPE